ncbi:MAG: septal ring lytic transglycosylase RlpA family lipoprotein [Acidobacteria bacterium]|nr:MAG: septal ring lytic transglycosylase RlpA family lipoprotein [Acidobacteriota bacterium]PYT61552.1 MAG: septal ring lytic transglycosylase RlpA family lipoprotein [Acidobacteriota bacterium]
MPPALRRIRNHDLGRLVIFTRVSLSQRVAPCVIYFLGFLLPLVLCGCGSRRPVAARQPTPPQPPETPSATEEAAKRSTNVPETPASQPAAAPASKRNKPAPAPASSGYTEEGNASWYGVPFHGRRASNGEIYDMYKLTAAHRTLPFETMVRVTNLNNGKSTVVRITDRGPFVDNRVIDLSFAAAREVDSIGPGVVPVRVEVISPGIDATSGFFTVQVGAFRDRGNADRLRDRLGISYSPIFIQQYDSPDGVLYRVRVGKISGEDNAHQFSDQLRQREGFTPFVTRLDEGTPTGGTR